MATSKIATFSFMFVRYLSLVYGQYRADEIKVEQMEKTLREIQKKEKEYGINLVKMQLVDLDDEAGSGPAFETYWKPGPIDFLTLPVIIPKAIKWAESIPTMAMSDDEMRSYRQPDYSELPNDFIWIIHPFVKLNHFFGANFERVPSNIERGCWSLNMGKMTDPTGVVEIKLYSEAGFNSFVRLLSSPSFTIPDFMTHPIIAFRAHNDYSGKYDFYVIFLNTHQSDPNPKMKLFLSPIDVPFTAAENNYREDRFSQQLYLLPSLKNPPSRVFRGYWKKAGLRLKDHKFKFECLDQKSVISDISRMLEAGILMGFTPELIVNIGGTKGHKCLITVNSYNSVLTNISFSIQIAAPRAMTTVMGSHPMVKLPSEINQIFRGVNSKLSCVKDMTWSNKEQTHLIGNDPVVKFIRACLRLNYEIPLAFKQFRHKPSDNRLYKKSLLAYWDPAKKMKFNMSEHQSMFNWLPKREITHTRGGIGTVSKEYQD